MFSLTNQISLKRFAPTIFIAFVVLYVCNSEVLSSISLHAGTYMYTSGWACGASHLHRQVYVHMGGDPYKTRGIPEKHNKLQVLLDPLRQRGFAARPRSGAERVGALD